MELHDLQLDDRLLSTQQAAIHSNRFFILQYTLIAEKSF